MFSLSTNTTLLSIGSLEFTLFLLRCWEMIAHVEIIARFVPRDPTLDKPMSMLWNRACLVMSHDMMVRHSYAFHMSRLAHAALVLSALALTTGCPTAAGEVAEASPEIANTEVTQPAKIPSAEPTTPPPAKVLYLQPLGKTLSKEAVDMVENALREFYGFNIKRASLLPLPQFAYYPPRKRYRAEKLLTYLRQKAPREAFRVLGVTKVDISTTAHGRTDWGIMGLASIDGQVSVMSMFRCKRGSRSQAHARERLGKVAVHEVGHTLGLEHCPVLGCLMEDARGTNTTTDREYVLCPRCRQLLARRGFNLPPNPSPPWPRP